MKEKYSLDTLPLNITAKIDRINCVETLKNRIFDLGIIEKMNITPIYRSPFGDPTAYLIKNAVIALRKEDCKNIIVTPL